jgi:lysozyme
MSDFDHDLMRAELTRDEGLRLKPYRDTVGKLTIGIGRNLDDRGISEGEAAVLLDNDIGIVASELDRALPWWRGLDPVRQRVLVNMGFNMGVPGLLGFHTTLGLVQSGDYADAAAAMLESKWASEVGARAERLAAMMRTGSA